MNNYHLYAKVLAEICEKKGNFKTIIFNKCKKNNIPKSRIGSIFAIIIKIYKNLTNFKELISLIQKKISSPIKNKYLFMILLMELYHNKDSKTSTFRRMGGVLMKIIKQNKELLLKELTNFLDVSNPLVRTRIYLRLIRPRLTIDKFTNEFFTNIKNENNNDILANKYPNIFIDKHIPSLISIDYNIYSKYFNYLSIRKDLLMQGKSSCFPAYILLNPLLNKIKKNHSITNKKINIFDTCAAPGNKTLQLAEYMHEFKNSQIVAYEKNEKRFKILTKRIQEFEFQEKIKCICDDFLKTNPLDKKYNKVKFALVDPSCSGSGMRNQLFFEKNEEILDFEKFCLEKEKANDKKRIEKLAIFQEEIILHCMKFPKIKRISYSTCSLFTRENENVVINVLNKNNEFELINLKGETSIGIGFGEIGKSCLRANPFKEEIDGFFVALFRRKLKKDKQMNLE